MSKLLGLPPETFLFGIICATSIYFFTKNKWGSTLLSAPISAIYLFVISGEPLHIYSFFVVLLLQYLIIMFIEKFTTKVK